MLGITDIDLKQTRFYQDVLAEGTLEGRRTEAATLLMRLAQVRFGDVPAAIQAAIADAELEQLEHWLERLVIAPSLAAIFTDTAH